MSTVILCEKRSQAAAISEAMHWSGMSGQYAGTNYKLTWASGHLLEFVTPDTAKPDARWSSPASLLPLPTEPAMVVSKGQSKSVKRVKDALKSAKAVVLSTDPDREGEAIGRNLLAHCKCRLPMKRLWLAGGMDERSIKKAFDTMRDEADSRGLMRAQQARSTADWLYMFVTRGFTAYARAGGMGSRLGQGKGRESVASIGRVQTPTLALIVARDAEIANFKSVTHYLPKIEITQNDVSLVLDYHPVIADEFREGNHDGITWQPQSKGPDKPLFTNKASVDSFAKRLMALGAVGIAVGRKDGKRPAPMCYALIDLQRAASTRLKMSSKNTLAAAQALYTAGYISYPRTEHRELPNEAYDDAPQILSVLAGCGYKPAKNALDRHTGPDAVKPRAYKNKAMEHHGLMPTEKAPARGALKGVEAKLYDMIVQRYIEAHLPDAQTEITAVQAKPEVQGLVDDKPARFATRKERIIDPGWMAAFGRSEQGLEADDALANITSDQANIDSAPVATGKTKPPAHYTENTLLGAMKNAARFLEGADAKTMASANGLGTPATRSGIIETLIARGYIQRSKKGQITATNKGIDLIEHAPDRLSDIAMTAEWEAILSSIEGMDDDDATAQRTDFIDAQAEHLTDILETIIQTMKDNNMSASNGSGPNKPTEGMRKFAERISNTLGVEADDAVFTDFDTCKTFIDDNVDDFKAQAPSTNPPTDKMLAFARSTAKNQGIELPEEAETSFDACKAFLDENAGNNTNPPTRKMLDFARKLAKEKSLKLPKEADTSFDACKTFLDKNAG